MRQNRRNRIMLSEDTETRRLLYIAGGVLVLAVVAFVVTFLIYTNAFTSGTEEGEIATLPITQLGETATQEEASGESSQASNPIGKTVNEVSSETGENEQTKQGEDTKTTASSQTEPLKIAVNTSNMAKENTTSTETTNKSTSESTTKTENKKPVDPTFIKPVEGELTKEFAQETLIYSDTLQEWVTHFGIDIKADKATVVKATADGTIKSIKNDPRYGITVVIEHENEYKTIYSNLLTAEYVKEGENVTSGQTIGTVGNTATFEIADEPHLHFEMLKDGEYIDPSLKITF